MWKIYLLFTPSNSGDGRPIIAENLPAVAADRTCQPTRHDYFHLAATRFTFLESCFLNPAGRSYSPCLASKDRVPISFHVRHQRLLSCADQDRISDFFTVSLKSLSRFLNFTSDYLASHRIYVAVSDWCLNKRRSQCL
jgi:hypothetical protein